MASDAAEAISVSAASEKSEGSFTAEPVVSAETAVLIDAASGKVLYDKRKDAHMYPASTTKIMTALVVLEHCALEEPVEILPEYTSVEGSSMYLRAGETYTVEELLYGMMLVSGNDAAVALACHTAGSVQAFADMMNDKARALGMTGSAFQNPNGLDAEGHYSTARDMAALTCAAMANDTFCTIVATERATIGGQTLVNHNRLLRCYDGTRGKWRSMGKLFYVYYPAHLALIGVLRVLLWGAGASTAAGSF